MEELEPSASSVTQLLVLLTLRHDIIVHRDVGARAHLPLVLFAQAEHVLSFFISYEIEVHLSWRHDFSVFVKGRDLHLYRLV